MKVDAFFNTTTVYCAFADSSHAVFTNDSSQCAWVEEEVLSYLRRASRRERLRFVRERGGSGQNDTA